MNNWQAICYIFLGFGFVFFIVALIVGMQASSAYELINQAYANAGLMTSAALTAGMRNVLFMAIVPFAAVAAMCWVVAVVGAVMGSKKKKKIVQATF